MSRGGEGVTFPPGGCAGFRSVWTVPRVQGPGGRRKLNGRDGHPEWPGFLGLIGSVAGANNSIPPPGGPLSFPEAPPRFPSLVVSP